MKNEMSEYMKDWINLYGCRKCGVPPALNGYCLCGANDFDPYKQELFKSKHWGVVE